MPTIEIPDAHKHLKNGMTPAVYETAFKTLIRLADQGLVVDNYNLRWITGLKLNVRQYGHQLLQLKRREIRRAQRAAQLALGRIQ